MGHEQIFPWEEFLERYLIYHEEFMFIYREIEYHFAFSADDKGNMVAELNVGTQEIGYDCYEYKSPQELLNKARINGFSIKELWDEFE